MRRAFTLLIGALAVALSTGCGSARHAEIESAASETWGSTTARCRAYKDPELFLCALQQKRGTDDAFVCARVAQNGIRYVPVSQCGVNAPGLLKQLP
jgi:hypothetical protein